MSQDLSGDAQYTTAGPCCRERPFWFRRANLSLSAAACYGTHGTMESRKEEKTDATSIVCNLLRLQNLSGD